jgi:high affinity Mn2+ porin
MMHRLFRVFSNQPLRLTMRSFLTALCLPFMAGTSLALLPCAQADEATDGSPENWNLHAQATLVQQGHPAFTAAYSGPNSLSAGNNLRETFDATLFAGMRLWTGAALYVNPEIDQGYGLNNTLGVADFPSGAAYKVGAQHPYFRLPRAFVRQVIAISGEHGASTTLASGPNQLAESVSDDNVTVTLGKFSVVDIFDTNRYAHDPRADFLNWGVIDGGAFDYAADAWGYTDGGAIEWTQSWWTLRSGLFALSKVPNSKDIDGRFRQYSLVLESEARHRLGDHPGKLKLLAFSNRGNMGRYDQALAQGTASLTQADTATVRHFASRAGITVNAEQELSANAGGFARLSWNQGAYEAYEFTEVNKSAVLGLSFGGAAWGRPDDTIGTSLLISGLSAGARAYLGAGGLGILIGDGRLHYGLEKVSETYYAARLGSHTTLSADVQWVANPGYNRDRGPVPVLGVRLHADF